MLFFFLFAAVDCGPPGQILNGSVIYTNTTFMSIVQYQCDDGHFLLGSRNRTCSDNAKWQPSAPNCQRVSCPAINSIKNGKVLGKTFTFTSVLHFACSHGYNRSGPASVQCRSNKTWTDNPPQCNIVTCGDPGVSTGTTSQGAMTTYNSSIRYACLYGHQAVDGNGAIRCQASGQWDGNPLQCTPIPCPDLPTTINNGDLVANDNFTFGDKATYSCNFGHHMVGQRILTCLANGTWSHPVPQCQGQSVLFE